MGLHEKSKQFSFSAMDFSYGTNTPIVKKKKNCLITMSELSNSRRWCDVTYLFLEIINKGVF